MVTLIPNEAYDELISQLQSAYPNVKNKRSLESINIVVGPIVEAFFTKHGQPNKRHRIITTDNGEIVKILDSLVHTDTLKTKKQYMW